MTTMYQGIVNNGGVPRITTFTLQDETLISYPPDLEYFTTFEEAKIWLQKRTWERVMEAQEQVARMDVDYNAALALKEEDV